MTVPAWKQKPSWFLVPVKDRMISPVKQRSMAERIGARIHFADVDHTPLFSAPDPVVRVIVEAADAVVLKSARLVTGSGRGIGKAIACRFAQGGAKILLVARSQHELDESRAELLELTSEVHAVALDLTLPDSAWQFVAKASDLWAGLDVLITSEFCPGATHGAAGGIFAASNCRMAWRARDSRDMTVPMGISKASAASL